jgi:small subunit ribosomal protein S20
MPQIEAAKKALRQNQRRRVINDKWRDKVRASIRSVKAAVLANDTDAATAALVVAQSNLDRASRRNILHPNTASRKKAFLARTVAGIKK